MLLFIELSVDLRKGKLAKDGLYQYKNMAQNSNVGTIEVSETGSVPQSASPPHLARVIVDGSSSKS